jgi:hypothetical protein
VVVAAAAGGGAAHLGRSPRLGPSAAVHAQLHLRGQELSLRDIADRLVIATGKKNGQHPSPATVMRMVHEQKAAAAGVNLIGG